MKTEKNKPVAEEPAVEVYRTYDWGLAEMVGEFLKSQGIVPAVRSNSFNVLFPSGSGCALADVAVQVLESNVERARELVKEYLAQIGVEEPPKGEEQQ